MAKKKQANHYIDNKQFLHEMVAFRNSVIEAKAIDKARPRIPDYIGECFIKIATHLSYKPNFINYTFREDMIADGVENCLQYIDNFDPAKSHNPFAYFTQIIYYAFLRRIQKEKKQLYIKYKAMERTGLIEELVQQGSHGEKYNVKEPSLYANMYDFLESFEESVRNQKKKAQQNKKKKKGLEVFEEKEEEQQ